MKKIFLRFFILFIIVVSSFEGASYASMEYLGQKLKRGATNILVSPAEIAKSMINETANASMDYGAPLYGFFYGIPKGVGYGAARLASGALDLVTFPLNIPKNRSLLPMDPFSFGETKESVLNPHNL